MAWVSPFYSQTGRWWSEAEGAIGERDLSRVAAVARTARTEGRVLELGCGYGTTAAALAHAGYQVTAVDLSDRVDLALKRHARLNVEFIRGDFYEVELGCDFDLVCYWDGFGVGQDDDQRRLLRRIADEWLTPDGVALIDIYNPLVWAGWHGLEERKEARPDDGYKYTLQHRRFFDAVNGRAIDQWWEEGADEPERWTQSLRCYSPAELKLLLEGTGLRLREISAREGDTSRMNDLLLADAGHILRCSNRRNRALSFSGGVQRLSFVLADGRRRCRT